jgi:hypothetical protein
MDFKTAYAKFCTFVLLEKVETNELNGTKLRRIRSKKNETRIRRLRSFPRVARMGMGIQ